ncbi:MAG: hypothetical protein ACP5VX_06715 [Thermogladius sp.]
MAPLRLPSIFVGGKARATPATAPARPQGMILDLNPTTKSKAHLPRYAPRSPLEDWFLTGRRHGQLSRELYRTAYERQAVAEALYLKLAKSGLTLNDAKKLIGKNSKAAEEVKNKLIIAGINPDEVASLVKKYEELHNTESSLEEAKVAMERRLAYERAHLDDVIARRVDESVMEARSMAVAASRGAEVAREAARPVAATTSRVAREGVERVRGAGGRVREFLRKLREV